MIFKDFGVWMPKTVSSDLCPLQKALLDSMRFHEILWISIDFRGRRFGAGEKRSPARKEAFVLPVKKPLLHPS